MRWPGQIESDLLDKGLNIADWHQGTRDEHGRMKLSSRRLLEVLEWLPDTSAFKKWAERAGNWSIEQRIQQTIANEMARLRASFHAAARNSPYEPTIWLSPHEVIEQRETEEVGQEAGELLGANLFGGWA